LIKEKANQPERTGKEKDGIIMEVDEKTHELMLKEKEVNVDWRKCPCKNVSNHSVDVKRCFTCWEYCEIVQRVTSVQEIIQPLNALKQRKDA